MTIEEARDKYLNKRVDVAKGSKNPSVGGVCDFLGPNEYLKIPLQITVDRMPLTLDSLEQISLQKPIWSVGRSRP